jgi:hypothetical protein
MIRFDCKGSLGRKEESWHGHISKLVYSGSHMEISIHMEEPVIAVVCKTLSGFFVYFPYYETGANLASLFDIDENAFRLASIFLDKKAITVASAIAKVGNMISKPRRKRRVSGAAVWETSTEMPF